MDCLSSYRLNNELCKRWHINATIALTGDVEITRLVLRKAFEEGANCVEVIQGALNRDLLEKWKA